MAGKLQEARSQLVSYAEQTKVQGGSGHRVHQDVLSVSRQIQTLGERLKGALYMGSVAAMQSKLGNTIIPGVHSIVANANVGDSQQCVPKLQLCKTSADALMGDLQRALQLVNEAATALEQASVTANKVHNQLAIAEASIRRTASIL